MPVRGQSYTETHRLSSGVQMRALPILSLAAPAAAAALAALGGCGPSNAPHAAPPRVETVRITNSAGGTSAISIMPSAQGYEASVAASPGPVWRALPAAYDSLKIPVTRLDSADRIIGGADLRVRRVLGKVRLSRYLECGTTQIDPNADSYEIHLSVLTRVHPAASGGSMIATTVEAMARSVSFAAEWVRCTSKGELESRLVQVVMSQVQP